MVKILNLLFLSLLILLFLLLLLLIFRELAPSEIDDVTPGIPCFNQQNLMKESQTLWVIPDFKGVPISDNKTWCKKILELNKTLGLHGVRHTYNEFGTDRNQSYLNEGIKIFKACFGSRPTEFKPPQLNISKRNEKLISKNNMILKKRLNQLTHRVYHCNDTGEFSNKFIELF